jgi:hypothetical protein
MTPWYVSRTVRVGDMDLRAEGTSPWNVHAFDVGFLGDHARWALDLEARHAMRRWRWWQRMPPRVTTLRMVRVRPASTVEAVAGLALAAYAVVRGLRA